MSSWVGGRVVRGWTCMCGGGACLAGLAGLGNRLRQQALLVVHSFDSAATAGIQRARLCVPHSTALPKQAGRAQRSTRLVTHHGSGCDARRGRTRSRRSCGGR